MKRISMIVLWGMLAGCGAPRQPAPHLVRNAQAGQTSGEITTLVGRAAPDFEVDAVMADNTFGKVQLSSLQGKYVLLFFYPGDFTFVCPTEIIAFDQQLDAFKTRDCEVIGVSVDSKYTHLAWKRTPRDKGGLGDIRYPLGGDLDKRISRLYGALSDDGTVALRAWFLIDKAGTVRHALVNDLPLGRNVKEALRMVEALRFVDTHPEVCPVNWEPGDKGLEATTEGVADYLGEKEN